MEYQAQTLPCPECQGTGQIEGSPCTRCSGSGRVASTDADIKVAIDDSGRQKRERHHGLGSDGMHRGDAVKPTHIEDHGGIASGGTKKT